VATDLKRDYARTLYADLGNVPPERVSEAFAAMEAAGGAMLHEAGIPPDRQVLRRLADVRYRRQAYELTLPIEDGPVTRAMLDRLAADFHEKHKQTYGHANPEEAVQLVNLRLSAIGRLPDLTLSQIADAGSARVRQRDVWFPATGFALAEVHWRDGLVPGTVVAGPAIVEALDSTTVVPPGWSALVDGQGYLILTRSGG
jgi:N-methylhydantoinase A